MILKISSPKQLETIWGKAMALGFLQGPYSCLKVGGPPRGRTRDLLIKSTLFFVHRHVLVCLLDTLLRLNAKIVPAS